MTRHESNIIKTCSGGFKCVRWDLKFLKKSEKDYYLIEKLTTVKKKIKLFELMKWVKKKVY